MAPAVLPPAEAPSKSKNKHKRKKSGKKKAPAPAPEPLSPPAPVAPEPTVEDVSGPAPSANDLVITRLSQLCSYFLTDKTNESTKDQLMSNVFECVLCAEREQPAVRAMGVRRADRHGCAFAVSSVVKVKHI
jgi:hypothetical protein